MVEANQKIPTKDEALLRPVAQSGDPFAPSRVFDERPLRGAPLTSLPAREATGVRGAAQIRNEKDQNKLRKSLDNAADVIQGRNEVLPDACQFCGREMSLELANI